MAKPAQAPLQRQGQHAWYFCPGQDISVGDPVLPSDPRDPPEVAQVKGVESALLTSIHNSGVAAVEQRAKHTGLAHLRLDVGGQRGVVPDSLRQERCCCYRFPNSCV